MQEEFLHCSIPKDTKGSEKLVDYAAREICMDPIGDVWTTYGYSLSSGIDGQVIASIESLPVIFS